MKSPNSGHSFVPLGVFGATMGGTPARLLEAETSKPGDDRMLGLKALRQYGAEVFDHREPTCCDDRQRDMASGLAAGTRVATAQGWRLAEGVIAGDRVLTFDGGMQTVTSVERGRLWTGLDIWSRRSWPLRVPPGALDNAVELVLLPDQTVMIELDDAEVVLGDPFALVPARALDGFRGITRFAPDETIEVIKIHFDRDQVVFVESGALCLCPASGLAHILHDDCAHPDFGYRPLETGEAEALIRGNATPKNAALHWDAQAASLVAANRP